MTRFVSRNQLPVRAASILSLVRISNGRLKRRYNSSCHCSARLPGQTTRQRWRSPRAINSFMRRPAIIVLPAPGSSASRKRSGWRGSISWQTAVIWCGSGSTTDVCTARTGSNRWASRIRGPRTPNGRAHRRRRNSTADRARRPRSSAHRGGRGVHSRLCRPGPCRSARSPRTRTTGHSPLSLGRRAGCRARPRPASGPRVAWCRFPRVRSRLDRLGLLP